MLKSHLSKFYLVGGLILTGVILNACQTLSKEECAAADWSVIGESDGAAGHAPQDRFARHAKACAKIGVTPDQTLWNVGYQRGLVRYCTPANGLRVGGSGASYANVCPLDRSARFLTAYNLGKKAHDLRSSITAKNNAVSRRQADISQKLQSNGKLTPAQQTEIRFEITDLNRQNSTDQAEIARLSGQLALAERDVEDFRRGLANSG